MKEHWKIRNVKFFEIKVGGFLIMVSKNRKGQNMYGVLTHWLETKLCMYNEFVWRVFPFCLVQREYNGEAEIYRMQTRYIFVRGECAESLSGFT